MYLRWIFSTSLASLTRESGPQVIKGDPGRKRSPPKSVVAPRLEISDSALKFTHVLYNLAPGGLYFSFWMFLVAYFYGFSSLLMVKDISLLICMLMVCSSGHF